MLTCKTKMKHGPLRLAAKPEMPLSGLFIPSYSDMWVASALLFWYLALPSLMRVSFGVFQCRSPGRPEDRYLTTDMEEPYVGRVGTPTLLCS